MCNTSCDNLVIPSLFYHFFRNCRASFAFILQLYYFLNPWLFAKMHFIDENKPSESLQQQHNDSSSGMFAFLFYLAAVALAIFGVLNAYYDADREHRIAQADAYNYINFAGRGLVFVGSGIVCALLGIGCQILSCTSRLDLKK